MCGRYTLTVAWPELEKRFLGREANLPAGKDWQPRFNAAPGQNLPVVLLGKDGREIQLLKWGLVPVWAKDPSVGYKTINARSETVDEKPSFRQAFRARRCLVPVDSFFEWQREGKVKIPQRIFPQHDVDDSPGHSPVFSLAGIWENGTFSILTRESDPGMAKLHDRMPVLLEPSDEEFWLSSSPKETGKLKEWLAHAPPRRDWWWFPVSTQLNSGRLEGPELVRREPKSEG